ncbi:O-glucosyltransferase rumi-like protein [Thalictrum thalictroides]|uniref:O-glucosyltransferase rumi-like protein n=1 Tax=Thalictrum thalictroides TaxID=46969 RepID=A0A7J6USK5_THATH|nr:O-glucosyltransferase rumi-like protein [Thalictrum thalictroides]
MQSVAVTIKSGSTAPESILTTEQLHKHLKPPPKKSKIHYSLNCTLTNEIQTCPSNSPLNDPEYQTSSSSNCPDYFRWIHEDLQPWKENGITREMVERARRTANFRLVIVSGKVYVEIYEKAFQTRDTFTLWGILQLLKLYPGKLPDLDLMFDCYDRPVILSRSYREKGPNATAPPPLFRYCGNEQTLDLVFPDWSFWGWAEINIKPWDSLLKELKEGNRKVKWMDREPYAYWKGNPAVAETRQDLLKCNVSEKHDWNARLYAQDWGAEIQKGYKESNLADQCIHRYKIYIEGSAWSVSEKYILACDSLTLIVSPKYYDIFTRSLLPVHHYWPIKETDKCRSIKFAVDWGNTHKKKVQEIGKAASNFIYENLTMEYVYDYMFHLLNEYSKLLKFKPSIPEKAVEICPETMACRAEGLKRKFMMESMVKSPSDTMPCNLPPPMDPLTRLSFKRRKENSIRQLEMWQNKYWDDQSKQP